jgi:hypothetical protein
MHVLGGVVAGRLLNGDDALAAVLVAADGNLLGLCRRLRGNARLLGARVDVGAGHSDREEEQTSERSTLAMVLDIHTAHAPSTL